jgi:hypothetical protein
MPARDRMHALVRKVLTSDGWTITHDPLHLIWGNRDVYADLGAQRFVGAQKGLIRIAVEIKSFAGPSPIDALERRSASSRCTVISWRTWSRTATCTSP